MVVMACGRGTSSGRGLCVVAWRVLSLPPCHRVVVVVVATSRWVVVAV